MFCRSDIINYGNLHDIDFICTKTLCQGGDCCDFRFVKHRRRFFSWADAERNISRQIAVRINRFITYPPFLYGAFGNIRAAWDSPETSHAVLVFPEGTFHRYPIGSRKRNRR